MKARGALSNEAPRYPNALRALAAAAALCGCGSEPATSEGPTSTFEAPIATSEATGTPAESAERASATATPGAAPEGPRRDHARVIGGGDVCLGRLIGKEILRDAKFNPFASNARILGTADIRFVNLESQLSDQKGETQHPTFKLVFTGPPGGADALRLGNITIVSLANNHMWDYGKHAFFETLENLERAGVKYVGAGRTAEQAYGPTIVDVEGFRVAFVAATGIWNQGELKTHEGKDHVAWAEKKRIADQVKTAREAPGVDAVVVSYHGGEEYKSMPLQLAVDLHHAAVDAGADAVLGHHPHVAQGIEIYKGKPIYYSLGNYLMRTHGEFLETSIGFFARVTFSRGAPPQAEVCPFRISGFVAKATALADDPQRALYERVFRGRLRQVQGSIANPAKVGSIGEDGCAPLGM